MPHKKKLSLETKRCCWIPANLRRESELRRDNSPWARHILRLGDVTRMRNNFPAPESLSIASHASDLRPRGNFRSPERLSGEGKLPRTRDQFRRRTIPNYAGEPRL